jgi:fatty acid desaturase
MLQQIHRWNTVFNPILHLILFSALAILLSRLVAFPYVQLARRDIFVMKSLWLATIVLVACLIAIMAWVIPLTPSLLVKLQLVCLAPACYASMRYSALVDNQ